MSELRVFTIATIVLLVVGGILPLIMSSFITTDVELTGLRNSTYNLVGGGVDFVGDDFDVPEDTSFYTYLQGIEVLNDEFPVAVQAFLYLYLFILLYVIIKALPLT